MLTSSLVRHAQTALAAASARIPSPSHPLAQPPAGSALRMVMGDSGVPYLGHTLPMLYSTLEWSRDRYERYGSVSWMNFLGIRAIHAVGADAMADVLFNRDRSFSNAEAWGYFLNPFFQRGVMLLDFEEHVRHRRILQQAFTRPRLADYLAVMNVTIDRTIARWRMTPNFPLYPHVKTHGDPRPALCRSPPE